MKDNSDLYSALVVICLLILALLISCALYRADGASLRWEAVEGCDSYRVYYSQTNGPMSNVVVQSTSMSLDSFNTTNGSFTFSVAGISNNVTGSMSYTVGWPVPVAPRPQYGTWVKLTPVIRRQIDSGPWQDDVMEPTYIAATNSVELFRALRIDREQYVAQ